MKRLLVLVLLSSSLFATDGVYSGTGTGGKRGDVLVEVTIEDSKMKKITVIESQEDKKHAYKTLIKAMIKNNSTDVDAISGASMTSSAFVEAVKDAVAKSGLTL